MTRERPDLEKDAQGADPPIPWLLHVAIAAWVVGMLLFARRAPDRYAAAMQEDRVVEWWTMLLYVPAAIVQLRRAIRGRRAFDVLVGLFFVFVAGEEISWGQRLLGFTPPAPFLAHNTQQEFNLHNFASVFGRPKWILAFVLLSYGLLLPVVARMDWGRRLTRRLGATPPPLALAPWFVAAVALLVWYPVEFTGEWVECLAGALFLASLGLSATSLLRNAAATFGAACVLTAYSAHTGSDDPDRVACARAETQALLADVTAGGATESLLNGRGIHKRVWTAGEDGYLALDRTPSFRATSCSGAAGVDAAARRRYTVDPWGTAYWIKTARRSGGGRRILVYSFGPNRERDGDEGDTGPTREDDVVAEGIIQPR